jgi:hypothetical protein
MTNRAVLNFAIHGITETHSVSVASVRKRPVDLNLCNNLQHANKCNANAK